MPQKTKGFLMLLTNTSHDSILCIKEMVGSHFNQKLEWHCRYYTNLAVELINVIKIAKSSSNVSNLVSIVGIDLVNSDIVHR